MRSLMRALKKAREGLLGIARYIVSFFRQVYGWVTSILFASDQYGSWMRLIFFLILCLGFLVAFFPLMDALATGLRFMLEEGIPTIRNSVKVILDILRKSPGPVPGPVPEMVQLPQPGISAGIQTLMHSEALFTLAQRSMLLVIPLGFSFLLAGYYFQYLHRTGRFWPALGYVLRSFFPLPKPKVSLENGSVIQKINQMPIHRFGGPARVDLDESTSAVFERSNGQVFNLPPKTSRVVGTFERLRLPIYLGNGEVKVTAAGRTKDGVLLLAKNALFRYRIRRLPGGLAGNQPGIDPILEKMVYRHWLGNDWDKADKRDKSVHDLVETELHKFITDLDLVEFMGSVQSSMLSSAGGTQQLNMFGLFADDFSQHAGCYRDELHKIPVLDLEWLGGGEWAILSEVKPDEQIQAWQLWADNKRRWKAGFQTALGQAHRKQEIKKQLSNLSLSQIASLSATSRKIKHDLMVAYRDELNLVKQAGPLPDALSRDLEMVLQQIERLILELS